MKTIGVVGGVASGKSLVTKMLVELGAAALDADRAGHDVLAQDPDVHTAIRDRWGDGVFTPRGEVDRAAIAKKVFAENAASTADRKFLESLLHPRIGARLRALRDQFQVAGKPAVVLDAPLLLEAGWAPLCDFVLFVEVPTEKRAERAKKRGWTSEEFAARESAQWPIIEKRRHATHELPNVASEVDLREAVRNFWTENIGTLTNSQ